MNFIRVAILRFRESMLEDEIAHGQRLLLEHRARLLMAHRRLRRVREQIVLHSSASALIKDQSRR